jgi:hypothetical protein
MKNLISAAAKQRQNEVVHQFEKRNRGLGVLVWITGSSGTERKIDRMSSVSFFCERPNEPARV